MKHILLLALLLPLAAQAKLNVVATLPDLAAIAREVGGDHVNVTCIGRPNEDPHYIQAKPSYIVVLNRADLLIENGLELEIGWLPALLDQTRNPKLRSPKGRIVATEGLPVLDVPAGPVTRAMGHVHPGGNPHITLDPVRGKQIASNIAAALKRLAPAAAAELDVNLVACHQRIDAALVSAEQAIGAYRGAPVVTYHKSLTYFTSRFGLVEVNAIEPKPGVGPSPAHITGLVEQIKRDGVKVILLERWHDRRTADLLAQKTGAKVTVLNTQASCTGPGVYADVALAMARQIAEGLR